MFGSLFLVPNDDRLIRLVVYTEQQQTLGKLNGGDAGIRSHLSLNRLMSIDQWALEFKIASTLGDSKPFCFNSVLVIRASIAF